MVPRGWAVVLEVHVEAAVDGSDELRLCPLGAKGRPYREHFLDLHGLGAGKQRGVTTCYSVRNRSASAARASMLTARRLAATASCRSP